MPLCTQALAAELDLGLALLTAPWDRGTSQLEKTVEVYGVQDSQEIPDTAGRR